MEAVLLFSIQKIQKIFQNLGFCFRFSYVILRVRHSFIDIPDRHTFGKNVRLVVIPVWGETVSQR